jgi:hypothetical protein
LRVKVPPLTRFKVKSGATSGASGRGAGVSVRGFISGVAVAWTDCGAVGDGIVLSTGVGDDGGTVGGSVAGGGADSLVRESSTSAMPAVAVTIRPRMIQKPGSDLCLDVDFFINFLLPGRRRRQPVSSPTGERL